MRIERLVVEGFGPFAARQEIDFRPLDAAGLFLITGRTGSGKSSLLDAICFALYGSAPRYDGTSGRLRSDHAGAETPTRVELEFAVAGERWRVVRSPEYERPKKRGGGTTRSPQAASLERLEGDEWVGIAARPVDVAEHLQPVLQLTREQFLQVILLAQGRFQDFLRAKSEDRLGLLRALFGTERFAKVEEELTQRARALEESVSGARAAVRDALDRLGELAVREVPADAELAWANVVVAALGARAEEALAAERAADLRFRAADRAAADAAALGDVQRRRDTARAEVARLDADEAVIAGQRTRLDDAVRALPVLPTLEALNAAEAAMKSALADRKRAAAALDEVVDDPASAASAADSALGALEAPLQDERGLPAMRTAAESADREADQAGRLLETGRQLLTAVPERRRTLRLQREDAARVASGAAEARSVVEQARAIHEAAVETAGLLEVTGRADAEVVLALAREQGAVAATRRLVSARIADSAGRLAATLLPDQPCPVCGAPDHPSPAAPGGDPVDDASLAAAEAAQQEAAATRDKASAIAAETRQALAVARSRALGRSVEEAVRLVADADAGVAIPRAAAARLTVLDADLARLDDDEARRNAEVRTPRPASRRHATRRCAPGSSVTTRRHASPSPAARRRRSPPA